MQATFRSKGFTLIEVMIALIILAIGLLGMATLMTQSLQSSESAYSRGQATLLAYDIIDRMRANKVLDTSKPFQNYRVSHATLGNNYTLANPSSCPNTVCAADCEGAEKATSDLTQWCRALNSSLPNLLPATSIVRNGTNGYRVRVEWQEPSGETSNVIVEAEL
ncbi:MULTISPECIES: type IV pilus modification protein PilV [unclassified Pseudomonas]|uniref:type IV pilus modification protein PilV n=1 Tax=unclassified Pseudomonas TaxID=196821 RepID=UPI00244D6A31|nr:type IV pilus modification protein PilV [Pseudomonas sp. GD03944]MDH1262345.1 type IV pilus modification protein PilV [Pseudomonas sp. GD03944]